MFWEIPSLLSLGDVLTSKFPKTGRKNLDPDSRSRSLGARQGGVKPATTAFPGSSASHGTHGINYAETIRFPLSDSC